jgi:hypothetical protein
MADGERTSGCRDRDHDRCPCCDPGLLDDLKCNAKGIAAQAKYLAEQEPGLDSARTEFDVARAAYNKARSAAEPEVEKAHRDLEDLEDRIRCQLDHEERERIDQAFGRIVERLDRCGHERGCCCSTDCDYDDDVRECDPDDVPGRLAVIERRTKEATECFWDVIGEQTVVQPPPPPPPAAALAPPAAAAPAPPAAAAPAAPAAPEPSPADVAVAARVAAATPANVAAAGQAAAAAAATAPVAGAAPAAAQTTPAVAVPATPAPAPPSPAEPALPARVDALQAEIEALSKATADGSWRPDKLYAALLVARRHLHNVWRGFDNVNEYMDCLCRALTCMIKGHAAIGELTRQEAVNQCHRDCWKAGCKYLAESTVAEVLAEYLRVRAEEECEQDRARHRDTESHSGQREREEAREREAAHDHEEAARDREEAARDREEAARDRDGGEPAGQRSVPYRDARGRYRAP